MFNLLLKNERYVVTLEEYSVPIFCDSIEDDSFILSLRIKISKNNKGKAGKVIYSYTKTWTQSCTYKVFTNFIFNFFKDIKYREQYRLSSTAWLDEFILSDEDILSIKSSITNSSLNLSNYLKKRDLINFDVKSNIVMSKKTLEAIPA